MRRPPVLTVLTILAVSGCSRPDDAQPAALLETPLAVTHNPLGADPAGRPPADSTAGTFDGYYSEGFEHAGFVPCADSSETWWTSVPASAAAELSARYTAAVGDSAGAFGRSVPVWARLRGRATPRRDTAGGGGYGHLGAYTRAFAVDSVEAVVRDTVVTDCPARATLRP